MRRHFSLSCLIFAWLCANGALWNVVQVVAWARMLHDYSQVMPAAKAVEVTFDGSAPCAMCTIAQKAQDTTRDELPREAALGANERLLLACHTPTPLFLLEPDRTWPGVARDAGPTRIEAVPVPPPRV